MDDLSQFELSDYERLIRYALLKKGGSWTNDLKYASMAGGYVVSIRVNSQGQKLGEDYPTDDPSKLSFHLMDYHHRSDVQNILRTQSDTVLGIYVEKNRIFFDVSRLMFDKQQAIIMGKRPDAQGKHENSIYDPNAPDGQEYIWLEYYTPEGTLYHASINDRIPPSDNEEWQNSPFNPALMPVENRRSESKQSWQISSKKGTAPEYEVGQKVRKKFIGNGYIHGVVVDVENDPDIGDWYIVSWENGPVERSKELPRHLMKAEEFIFAPHSFKAAASQSDMFHEVPQFDHRKKVKYAPGDWVQTNLGICTIINTANTPLGQIYRCEAVGSGAEFDLFEDDLYGKVDKYFYGKLANTVQPSINHYAKNLAILKESKINAIIQRPDMSLWAAGIANRRQGSTTASSVLHHVRGVLAQIPDEAYKLIPWVVREAKQNRISIYNSHSVRHAIDIVRNAAQILYADKNRAPKGVDVMQMNFSDLESFVYDWNRKNASNRWEERNVLFTTSDGWTVEEVRTAADLIREGDLMNHCAGGYCSVVAQNLSRILSLRDPGGNPHVTIEIDPNPSQLRSRKSYAIKQVFGKGNSSPQPQYEKRVAEWIAYEKQHGSTYAYTFQD